MTIVRSATVQPLGWVIFHLGRAPAAGNGFGAFETQLAGLIALGINTWLPT